MKHIFDLDNTLVYTDRANNLAYNRALQQAGLEAIRTQSRITRKTVQETYPHLTGDPLQRIVFTKQSLYSVESTQVNKDLLQHVRAQRSTDCLVWSSAHPTRAFSVLRYHNLDRYFSVAYFSRKKDIVPELEILLWCFHLEAHEVIVYEDNDRCIQELRDNGIRVMDAKQYHP